jgi:hypothetical protein
MLRGHRLRRRLAWALYPSFVKRYADEADRHHCYDAFVTSRRFVRSE